MDRPRFASRRGGMETVGMNKGDEVERVHAESDIRNDRGYPTLKGAKPAVDRARIPGSAGPGASRLRGRGSFCTQSPLSDWYTRLVVPDV